MHEEIAKHFPKLAPFIKWHLCSSDGPMHYIGNVMYFAGDRDCHGLTKGEFKQFTDKDGIPKWIPESGVSNTGSRTIASIKKPEPLTVAWVPWGRTGEGKVRELDAARRCAIWPDATDAELCAPDLKQRLEARLPALMEEFKSAMESLGFVY